MIHYKGSIFYKDGRVEPWEAGGAIQAAWEEYAGRHDLPMVPTPETLSRFPIKRWSMFLAWASLELEEGFDSWARTVLDVDLEGDAELVPPTLPEAFAAASSSLPS